MRKSETYKSANKNQTTNNTNAGRPIDENGTTVCQRNSNSGGRSSYKAGSGAASLRGPGARRIKDGSGDTDRSSAPNPIVMSKERIELRERDRKERERARVQKQVEAEQMPMPLFSALKRVCSFGNVYLTIILISNFVFSYNNFSDAHRS